jgi:hypothetical protein
MSIGRSSSGDSIPRSRPLASDGRFAQATSSMPEPPPVTVTVPLQDSDLAPSAPDRVRRLRRHLVEAMRDLREAKRPDRLIQPATEEPTGFARNVVREGCAQCRGFCCKGGGEHAYIDERTMARVRRDRPDLDARAIIRCYVEALAPLAYRDSCLFHSRDGCTLPRSLRAELCNSYYCNGLRDFLKHDPPPERVVIVATRGGVERRAMLADPGTTSGP